MKKIILFGILILLLVLPISFSENDITYIINRGSITINVDKDKYLDVVGFYPQANPSPSGFLGAGSMGCGANECTGKYTTTISFGSVNVLEPGDYFFVISAYDKEGKLNDIRVDFNLILTELLGCEYRDKIIPNQICVNSITQDDNDKPKFCNRGNIIDKCGGFTGCGCPGESVCLDDGSCSGITPTTPPVEEATLNTAPYYISGVDSSNMEPSIGDVITLTCNFNDEETSKEMLNVKIWLGTCIFGNCFNTREWEFYNAQDMQYNSVNNNYKIFWKVPNDYAGRVIAATCTAFDEEGLIPLDDPWLADKYPLFTIKEIPIQENITIPENVTGEIEKPIANYHVDYIYANNQLVAKIVENDEE